MKKLIQKVCVLLALIATTAYGLSAQGVLNETFENGFEPNGWTQLPASATTPWAIGSSGVGNVSPYQGSNMVKLYSATHQNSIKLISKSLDVTGILEPTLDFYMAAPKFSSAESGDTMKIYFKTGATWELAQFFVTSSSAWQKKSIRIKDHITNPTNFQVAFEWVYGNGKGIALDNIVVYGASACTTPLNMRARNGTSTSAGLTWNSSNYAVSHRVKIFTSPVADASQIETAAAVIDAESQFPIYEATGLTPETTYYWYVKSSCSAVDASEWSPAGKFKTLCATQAPPTGIDSFDSYATDTMPTCWTPVVDFTGQWDSNISLAQFLPKVTTAQSSNDGGKSLQLSSMFSKEDKYNTVYAISPRFSVTSMNTYQLKFKLRSPSTNNVLSVGTMTDAYVSTTFAKAKDISVDTPDVWQDVVIYLNNITGNSPFFAFKVDSENGENNLFFIDELEVSELPACATPIFVSASNATRTSVDLSWSGNSASYEIKAYKTLSNPATDVPLASAQNAAMPHTLTGLDYSSLYYFYIKGTCDGEWSQPIAFRTEQGPASIPFFDDFESDQTSWYLSNGTQKNKWHIENAVNNGGNKSLYISNDNGATNSYNLSGENYVYANQMFSLTAGREYSLAFDWKGVGESKYDYIQVFLLPIDQHSEPGMAAGGEPQNWIELSDKLSAKSTWQIGGKGDIVVPTTGEYYLTFLWKNDDSGGAQPPAAIDNVRFLEFRCGKVLNVVAKEVLDNSATITWSPPTKGTLAQYSVYVVEQGVDYTTVTPQTTTDTTIVLTGLLQMSKYNVYVVANCSGTDGNSDPELVQITTGQTPSAIPYSEDFEGATASLYLENGEQINKWTVGTADHNGAGSKSMYVSKDGNVREYEKANKSFVYAYSTFDLSNGEMYKLKFDWKSYGRDSADVVNVFLVPESVKTIVAGEKNNMDNLVNNLPKSWTKIVDKPLFTTSTDWQTLDTTVRVVASGRYKLVFFWKNTSTNGNANGAGAIDNISFNVVPCSSPSAITTESTSNSININWTTSANATAWNIAVVPTGSAPTTFTNVTTPSYTFAPATPNSVYQVYIYANCGENTVSDTIKLTARSAHALPFTADFEDKILDDYWTFSSSNPAHSPTNRWTIGTDAKNGGAKGMYISDNGSTNTYSTQRASVDYAYVAFDMEQDDEYMLKYDWKGMGEGKYDYLKAFIIPESYAAGIAKGDMYNISGGNNYKPVDWVCVSRTKLNLSTDWVSADTLFSVGATGKYYLAFLWTNDHSRGSQPPAAIDNVSLSKVLCKRLKNIVVSNISETGAKISWNASSDAASYEVKISTSPIDPETTNGDVENYTAITDNSIDLSGNLTTGTLYYAYLRSNCNNGSNSPYVMVRFSTVCAAKNIPYTENFDSYDHEQKLMPSCWVPVVYKSDIDSIEGDFIPFVDAPENEEDTKFLNMPIFYNVDNRMFSSSFAILPQIVEPINSTVLSFKAKAESDSAKIAVGTVSDINDAPTTFSKLGEFDITSEYRSYSISLDGFSGSANSRIVLVVEGDKLQRTNSVLVDDLRLEAISGCVTPTGINHTFVRNDSAILKWTSIYTSVKTFNVIVSTEDVGTDFNRLGSLTPAQTAFNQNIAGDSVVVTGLAENTRYYYYVRMVCEAGAYSPWFGDARTFITSCREANKCSLIIKTKDADGEGWGSSSKNPKLLISNSKGESLGEYRVKQSALGGAARDTMNLDTLVLCPEDYFVEYVPASDSNEANSFELILNDAPFYVSERMSGQPFLINFTINNGCVGFVCSAPGNMAATATTNSANITWRGNANGYDVRVYENSDSVSPSDPPQTPVFSQDNVAATSVNATGLAQNTTYAVFVRAVCTNSGKTVNSHWKRLTFSTKVDFPLTTLPFTTDFENDADNAKWVVTHSSINRWVIDSAVAKQGAKSLYISKSGNEYSYDNNNVSYSYAARKFSMSANETYMVEFDWRSRGETNSDWAKVFLIPIAKANIAGGNSNGISNPFVVPQGWIAVSDQLVSNTNWRHHKALASVPTDGEYLFVFLWRNDGSNGSQPPAAIDNLSIAPLACVPPKNLTTSNVSSTSVDLAWSGNSDKYTVKVYKTDRDTIDPDIHANFVSEIPNLTATSTSITGLEANTSYYMFVKGTCGSDNSPWNKTKLRTTIDLVETTVPFNSGFEDDADNAKWVFSRKQTNYWVISNRVNNGGAKAMYITNDNTAPFDNEYTIGDRPSYSYAFRKVELSANDTYSLSFDWRAKGEVSYDYGRVFLVPVSKFGDVYDGEYVETTTPTDWIDVGGPNIWSNILVEQDTWQSVTKEEIVVPTTGGYLLAFYWKNNIAGGDQTPLAIDNVAMSKLDCAGVVGRIALKKENNSIVANWNGGSDSYTVKLFEHTEGLDIATTTPLQEATVNAKTHTFSQIASDKIYLVAIQGKCGTLTSEWKKASISFMPAENLPLSTDFQNSTDNQKWRYSVNNRSNIKWVVGNATSNEDSNSLYISKDDGTTNSYDDKITAYAYAYRTVALEASKSYAVNFFWKSLGELNFDLLRAFIIPTSADIMEGNPNGMAEYNNTTPTGWIDIANPKGALGLSNIWKKSENSEVTVPSNGEYHLAFFWKNDNVVGNQPPAAIDNLTFKEVETVELTDNSCLGEAYNKNNFEIPADSLSAAGVYNFATTYDNPNGKYQIINLTLTVINSVMTTKDTTVCEGKEINFFGRKIVATTSEEYKHYAYSTNTGCDSVIRLNLTVNPSYTINIDTVITSLPATVGNRTFPAGYLNGEYPEIVPGTTALGCDSITAYNVIIAVPVGLDGANVSGLTIAPNPIEVGQSVEIRSEFSPQELNGLKVEVLNTAGSVLSTIMPKNKPIRIDGFRVSGVYVIRLTTGTGNVVYGKVIVK